MAGNSDTHVKVSGELQPTVAIQARVKRPPHPVIARLTNGNGEHVRPANRTWNDVLLRHVFRWMPLVTIRAVALGRIRCFLRHMGCLAPSIVVLKPREIRWARVDWPSR